MIAMIAAGCGLHTQPRTLSANLTYRGTNSSRGPISAISAINFLMSKLPKELKSFATRTKAPGPPMTWSPFISKLSPTLAPIRVNHPLSDADRATKEPPT
jgi:hypothetical protein